MTTLLGVDIGGTFTDFVLLHNGQLHIHKLLSTPDDPGQALMSGVSALGVPSAIVHGTTVATNALLERRGAATALITTAGFRDVLVIGRGDRPELYNLDVTRPEPLVPEQWRRELNERLDYTGAVLQPLDAHELEQMIEWLANQQIEAVAICLLHAYANPEHEQRVVAALRAFDQQRTSSTDHAGLYISASHQILPEPREYERTSTTVVNAYVGPALDRYLGRLGAQLSAQGVGSLRIMASDGGSMGLHTARELAARATLSGPAGGIVGAAFVAARAGFPRIITFDMGGTSTDVALCNGRLPRSSQSQVGGLPVRLPSLDIHTVGAGGGSLARIDAGGALRVGPQSAGANPGPACYGRGMLPTVTDANLLLGRLQPDHFLGGRMLLDQQRAEAAVAPLAMAVFGESAVDRTALGIVRVANATMERAIRTISVERGDDPRDFALVAFGGAGPLHATHLAEALGMHTVLVPRYPGVLSAIGMLAADVTRDASRTLMADLGTLAPAIISELMQTLADEVLAALVADGEPAQHCRIEYELELRYQGQSHELTVPLSSVDDLPLPNPSPISGEGRTEFATDQSPLAPAWARGSGGEGRRADLAAAATQFHELHERRYGHAMRDRPIEAVLLRARGISPRPELDLAVDLPARQGSLAARATVMACLSADPQPQAAALYHRDDMRMGDQFSGPAVVVQLDATTIIPPNWQAVVDRDLNLVLTRHT